MSVGESERERERDGLGIGQELSGSLKETGMQAQPKKQKMQRMKEIEAGHSETEQTFGEDDHESAMRASVSCYPELISLCFLS